LRFGEWKLDTAGRFLVDATETVVSLSGAEYRLLRVFLDHPQRVLNRDQLLDLTQGREPKFSIDRLDLLSAAFAAIARRRPRAMLHQDGTQRRLRLCCLRRNIAGAVMSAGFRHMVMARLWPQSLFGRLAIILFSGLRLHMCYPSF